jgi:hypothetical protein
MLIRHQGDDLLIVRQTDHMAQTARIAERWGNERYAAPECREEAIRAAGLHDGGWRLWEEHPTLQPETGRPCNLGEIEIAVHAAFYRAGVQAAVAVDPYTGLLVSLHAAVLYAGVAGWDPLNLTPPDTSALDGVQRAFVADQVALQRRLRAEMAGNPRYAALVAPDRLLPAYLRLRAWDQLSLYFLFHGMGDRSIQHVPVREGDTIVELHQTGPREATADPWPFDRPRVEFPVVETRIPDRCYASGDELLTTWLEAPQQVVTYVMQAP